MKLLMAVLWAIALALGVAIWATQQADVARQERLEMNLGKLLEESEGVNLSTTIVLRGLKIALMEGRESELVDCIAVFAERTTGACNAIGQCMREIPYGTKPYNNIIVGEPSYGICVGGRCPVSPHAESGIAK